MNQPPALRWIRLRMGLSTLALVGLFGVVLLKAYQLHAEQGTRLRELAEQQYLREIKLAPRRGAIVDRHGTPLALSVEVDSIYANPRVVGRNASRVARALAGALSLNHWALRKQLSRPYYFTWIKRRVTPREAKRVRALQLQGVFLTKESRRFYPNHQLASSVIGFAGLDARGLEGVELTFDRWLKGTPFRVAELHDAMGRQILSRGLSAATANSGHEIQLTIDKFIQYETEQALEELYLQMRPDTGWVASMVVDSKTGDILAMASLPAFDPNRYGQAKPQQWRNRAVTDAFEPGSTMKAFTVAAALEAGVIGPEQVFDCAKGRWRVGRYTIHDTHPQGRLDVTGILKKSSNIGIAKIGFELGKLRLYQSLRRYGFSAETQIPLTGERVGILRQPNRWSDVGLANIAFGQGLTTTVVQLTQAFTAIANGGQLMRPRLVLGIRDEKGQTIKAFAPQGRSVMAPWVAQTVLKMLTAVTEPGGTGAAAALDQFQVSGKTGTAQKVDPVTRSYSTDRWLSSFVGMVPASNPRLVIAVVANEPSGEKHYGGELAGPVFKRIAEKALGYLGVAPDRAIAQAPAASTPQPASSPAVSLTPAPPPLPEVEQTGPQVLVPDFTGMSMSEVLSAAHKLGLQVQLIGSGQAVAQSPGPGSSVAGGHCRVSFRPPG